MIPSARQWRKWSLPSKATFVGTVVGIASLALTLVSFEFLPSDGMNGATSDVLRAVKLLHEQTGELAKAVGLIATGDNEHPWDDDTISEIAEGLKDRDEIASRISENARIFVGLSPLLRDAFVGFSSELDFLWRTFENSRTGKPVVLQGLTWFIQEELAKQTVCLSLEQDLLRGKISKEELAQMFLAARQR